MNKQTNTPELRFPEFDEEWKKRKLGEVVNYKNGGSFESLVKNHGVYKLITLKSVNTEGKLCNSGKYIDDKCVETLCNDTLVMILSEQAPGLVGMTAIIPNNNEYVLNQRVAALVPKQFIDSQFLSKLINRNQKYFSVRSAGTKVKNISKGHVENFNFLSPNYTEQQKIGNFFSKLDRQIELEEEKLELLEQQKRGYMQKIFSQDLRFKDENGNEYPKWVTQKIKELGNVYTGNTPSKKQSTYWNSNNYIWVTPTDINNKKDLKNSEYMLSDEGFKKARQLPKNTLLITCIASIGKNAILREEGSCNQQINALVPNSDKDVDFLYYAFEKVSKYMKRIAGKTATQIVNKSTFENISIEVPIFEEQLKAGRFLNSFDKLIEKQVSKIELLKQRKQGLLQKMFV